MLRHCLNGFLGCEQRVILSLFTLLSMPLITNAKWFWTNMRMKKFLPREYLLARFSSLLLGTKDSWEIFFLLLNICVSPPHENSYVVALTLQPLLWLYLETGPIRRLLRLNDNLNVRPWYDRISVLTIERHQRGLLIFLSPYHVRAQQEDAHLQAQERGFTRNPNGWHLNLGLPNVQNCEEYRFVVHKPPSGFPWLGS